MGEAIFDLCWVSDGGSVAAVTCDGCVRLCTVNEGKLTVIRLTDGTPLSNLKCIHVLLFDRSRTIARCLLWIHIRFDLFIKSDVYPCTSVRSEPNDSQMLFMDTHQL